MPESTTETGQHRLAGIIGYHAYLPAYRLKRGEISSQELDQVSRQYNNVIAQTTTVLRAVKPAGS